MGSNASSTTKVKPFHYQATQKTESRTTTANKTKNEPVNERVTKVIVQPKRTNSVYPQRVVVNGREPTKSDWFRELRKHLTTPGPHPGCNTLHVTTLPGHISSNNPAINFEPATEVLPANVNTDMKWKEKVEMITMDQPIKRICQHPRDAMVQSNSMVPYLNNKAVANVEQQVVIPSNTLSKVPSNSSDEFVLEETERVTIGSCKNMQSAKGGLKYDVALHEHKLGSKPALHTINNAVCQDSQYSTCMNTKLKKKLCAAEIRRKV